MPRVTLEEIALRAGTDRGTVSRVLNGKAREFHIGGDVARRIQSIAADLQYVPNAMARALSAGRFGGAALLMSTDADRSYLPIRLLDGIHDRLADEDMHLTVARMPDDRLNSTEYIPKILRTLMADGLLINYTHELPPHLVHAVENRLLPAVWINTQRSSDAVYPDSRAAARRATEFLIESGHRRIAYADPFTRASDDHTSHFSSRDRQAGYQDAMHAAGLKPLSIRDNLPAQSFAEGLHQLLSRNDRVTAVLCYWATLVPAIIKAATELKLVVPRDLSIVTFAAEKSSDHRACGASLICEPQYEMGQEAVKMLLQKIERPDDALPARVLEFYWEQKAAGATIIFNSAD